MFLEHVNLTVTDLDRSVAFYCELLDFGIRWEGKAMGGSGGTIRAAHVGDSHCYLALFEAESQEQQVVDYARAGLNHYGFVVDDLEAARDRALGLGAKIHFEPEYEPGRRIYLCDPDGTEIELVNYAETG